MAVGVDIFGALTVKCHSEICKVYVALYTDLLTRSCHIEACMSLSAESFIMSFRRFCARRGKPVLLLSDNASGFVVAKEVLEQVWNPIKPGSSVIQYMTESGIKWKMIPALSPHFGRSWERLVGVVKGPLRRAIGRRTLSLESLTSTLCNAEYLANCRPLTFLYREGKALILRPIDLCHRSKLPTSLFSLISGMETMSGCQK